MISDALVGLGVSKKDIQAANYSFSFERPGFGDVGSRGGSVGRATYRVNNVLTVTIRDLDITGDIVDTAVVSGANQMWGVEFGVDDPGPPFAAATEKAVNAAYRRAAHLAGLAGLNIGKLLILEEAPLQFASPADDVPAHDDKVVFTVQVTAIYELVEPAQ